ncbi:MAG: hypothetical protein R3C09_17335 [Pirellulaceae bacterium]
MAIGSKPTDGLAIECGSTLRVVEFPGCVSDSAACSTTTCTFKPPMPKALTAARGWPAGKLGQASGERTTLSGMSCQGID